MKRLSLSVIAFVLLATGSGCCCGLGHGCNQCCGYPSACGYQQPVYAPSCPTCGPSCPTCPSGGCGVQGPVMPQSSFYDAGSMMQSSHTSVASPTLAASEPLPTYRD